MVIFCAERSRQHFCLGWILLASACVGSGRSFRPLSIAATSFRQQPVVGVSRDATSVRAGRKTEEGSEGVDGEAVATLRSLTFCLERQFEPDLLCELLMELGACATGLTDARRDTPDEVAIFGEPSVGTLRGGAYFQHQVWDVCNVTALFPDSVDLGGVVAMVQEVLWSTDEDNEAEELNSGHNCLQQSRPLASWDVRVVPDRDWVVHVQQSWKPLVVGRFVVALPWHSTKDVDEALMASQRPSTASASEVAPLPLTLQLEGGIAFGTGEHATTQLCLRWIEEVVSRELLTVRDSPLRVLDYGSGSGILGLAACALGREEGSAIEAVGIDLDVDACRIANANARRNNLSMRNYLPPLGLLHDGTETGDGMDLEVGDDEASSSTSATSSKAMDAESKSLLLKAHRQAMLFRRPWSQAGEEDPDDLLILPFELDMERFPVVVANILAGPLVSLAPTLMPRVAVGGKVGLSGVLSHQASQVVEAFEREGLEDVRVSESLGDWVLITGSRRRE